MQKPSSLCFICLAVCAACADDTTLPESIAAPVGRDPSRDCDELPTSVERSDYSLPFVVPPGLMPDSRFDGRNAQIRVHRVQPIYAGGKCPGVPTRAAVLVHGRTLPAFATFDLQLPVHPGAQDGELVSLQEALARAGIDSFAPDMLGYGGSTRFPDGLDDPHNASLRPYSTSNPAQCDFPEGCDRSPVPPVWPLDQQGNKALLGTNPLNQQRYAHSSGMVFATIDVFARDVRQVIGDVIERAQPDAHKVVLVGYSAGGARVARVLDPAVADNQDLIDRVSSVVFLDSLFGGPVEASDVPPPHHTYPLLVSGRFNPADGTGVCAGRVIPGYADQLWAQTMADDPIGKQWGGTVLGQPTWLSRSPTFLVHGWNETVAARLVTPALVIQGQADAGLGAPPLSGPQSACKIYDSLYGAEDIKKLLLIIACGTHNALHEGSNLTTWDGPQGVIKSAIIEWIQHKRVQGHTHGSYLVDTTGTANAASCPMP